MNPFGVFLGVVGVMVFLAALFDAAWLMDSARGRFFASLLSPIGARILYAVIGLIALGMGVLLIFGAAPEGSVFAP